MFVNKAIVVDVLITGKNQPKRQIRWLVSFLFLKDVVMKSCLSY